MGFWIVFIGFLKIMNDYVATPGLAYERLPGNFCSIHYNQMYQIDCEIVIILEIATVSQKSLPNS